MKRTATTLALLAGFGSGCLSTDGPNAKKQPVSGGYGTVTVPRIAPGYQGPAGESIPVTAARGAMPGGKSDGPSKVVTAGASQPAGTKSSGVMRAYVPGAFAAESKLVQVNGNEPQGPPRGGILPVPGMGPPGAVAAVGAINPMMRPMATNQRTSIKFTSPAGMKITWQLPTGGFNDEASGLTAPKDYNFLQGQVYRLRLTQVLPNFPGKSFYPTLEIAPATPKTLTYLAHASVPVSFADEDFRQAADGNLVVKVIYLPDPAFQDFAALGGAEEIVSTRLEPGADPVAEAQKRGTILAIIRLGNIDLENKASPAMTAPPPGMMPPVMMPPGMMPPGFPKAGGSAVGTSQVIGGPIAPPAPGGSASAPPIAKPVAPGPLPPALKDSPRPINLPPIK